MNKNQIQKTLMNGLTEEKIAECHFGWLAAEEHRQGNNLSVALKERLQKLNKEEFQQYLDIKNKIDKREARIEWQKKWENDHPWDKIGKYATIENFKSPQGRMFYSRNNDSKER